MQDETVSYRDSDHTYWKGGVRLPSVSQVCKVLHDYGDVPRDVLEAAAARGTAVHQACEFYDEGDLDMGSLDPRIAGYVEAYAAFRRETGFAPTSIEELVHHPALMYAGRLDRVGTFPNSPQPAMPWIVDIKTSSRALPSYAVQLAGYAGCFGTPHRRAVVHLGREGYKVIEYADRNDWKTFQAALAVWRWKNANQS